MDGRDADHHNRLHPNETPRKPYVAEVLQSDSGPIVAASDYVSAVPLSISSWVGPDYAVLGATVSGGAKPAGNSAAFSRSTPKASP